MPTTPGTPARRRREREEAYIAFNNNPKLVGTRTGIAMPTNVPRDSMGFEDGHAFFNSSPVAPDTDGRTTTYSRRTPGTGKTARTSIAPSTGGRDRTATSQTSRRKRMSDMGEDGPDDTFAQGGADLLLDDDFGEEDANATPFFKSRNITHVPLPPSSRRGGRTPSGTGTGDYANLPSPSVGSPTTHKSVAAQRKSKGAVASRLSASVSPQKRVTATHSRLSAVTAADVTVEMDELGDALEIDESLVDVQMDGSEAEEEEADNRRASAKSKGKGKAPAKSDTRRSIAQRQRDEVDEDEQEEEEDPSEEQPRKSRLSTKSNRSHIGDTLSDVGDGDRTRASIGINMDDTFDDAGFEADNYGDASLDGFPGEEREDEAGAEDGDADMERDAMEEEDEPGLDEIQEEDVAEDEEEEEEPVARPVKTAAKKVKTRLPPAKSAGRGQREDSAAVREKKRKRLSNFPNELDGNGYQGDFQTRRSGRQHISPLEYWRGEKVSYGKGQHQAVIKEVVTIPRDPVVPLGTLGKKARGHRGKSRGRSKSRHDSAPPIQEWDRETEQMGVVKDYITGEEEERRIVFPSHMLKTKLVQTVSGDSFGYQKTFGDDFHASGYVEIGVGQTKPTKPSRDNAYTFCVLEGVANVCIHRTAFVVAQHGQFEVPRGNEYKITNINDHGVLRLFFTQSRKVASTEEEDSALAAELAESASQASRAVDSQRVAKTPARKRA